MTSNDLPNENVCTTAICYKSKAKNPGNTVASKKEEAIKWIGSKIISPPPYSILFVMFLLLGDFIYSPTVEGCAWIQHISDYISKMVLWFFKHKENFHFKEWSLEVIRKSNTKWCHWILWVPSFRLTCLKPYYKHILWLKHFQFGGIKGR